MRGWYQRLPLRRTLLLMALAVATTASALAVGGTVAADVWRYRATAADDTTALASVIAENVAAAVVFRDVGEATAILASAGVRPTVLRSCLYLADGTLFAQYRRPDGPPCPVGPALPSTWYSVAGSSAVVRDRTLATVLVERELPELWTSVGLIAAAGLLMVVLAGLIAIPIAGRLHRRVSEPIEQLAAAVRAIGPHSPPAAIPSIDTALPEVGDLTRAFSDMLARVAEATDALRRKEAEREDLLRREREASRLKDEFLAAVSHELRTPLNAILGWSQILATTTPDQATTSKAIASIARNARAQTRLIEDLVDVSRIVTGKLTVRFDPVDLRDPVESAVELVRGPAEAKGVAVDADLPTRPCPVNGDRDRLHQIFGNLLSNAVKFTPSGGGIRVTMRAAADAYEVAVADDGIGIAPEFRQHVFDPFRQADGTTTRQYGGLGLGLAIVKELTALHGGTVAVDSPGAGRGATFTVRMPALDATPTSAPPLSAAPIARALVGVRVLAVDDNADALDMLQLTLEQAGAVVRTAASGRQALDLYARETPDVLLCDLAMPDMDGFEVLRRLGDRPSAPRAPAIAVSAHATDLHRARSVQAGFREHLAKPYPVEALIEVIQRVRSESSGEPRA